MVTAFMASITITIRDDKLATKQELGLQNEHQ
jgi:hypothetical protein